ncbi:flagellin [Bacillus timonensis]|uniref:Flagellin n=1 Tax=Bacillus timonensis TaxID=1033734 RepID=A0A4S3PRM8_9BACI|nr:flagellin [Bacillus timonensis]THE12347.1 flagellin [Bacillus timonensis]
MRINHNIAALNTYRQLGAANAGQSKSMEKLASGLRINRAGDDAAGLAISEKMRGQIRGLDMAAKNAQDGVSLIQTAEGALNETHSILQRMRELAVQSSNSTNTDEDRKALQNEVKQLKDEIDRIGNNTEFNTKKLINGDLSGSQVGGVGSKIGEATAAKLDSGTINPTTWNGNGTSNYQVVVDGQAFDLTGVDMTSTFNFFTDLEDKLNTAITNYNNTNPNNQITKPEFDIEVTSDTAMNFVITSGTTGSSSEITIKPMNDDGTTLDAGELPEIFTVDSTTKSTYTAGSDGLLTDDTAIDALTSSDKLSLSINGYNIDVDLTNIVGATSATVGAGAGAYADGEEMTNIATDLQSDIQAALNNYKDLTGTDFGNVTVSVEDGALKIESDKADTVNIQVNKNTASDALGLSDTATATEGGLNFHIGSNKDQQMNLQIGDMRASALNIADVDISTADGANNAIEKLDSAIKSVSDERAKLGAVQNRLEHTINNLSTSSENLTAAESRVRDVDMAKEMMEQTKNSILSQAAQAMLAQANQQPQGVLQLLR